MTETRTAKIALCQWCLPDKGPQGLQLAADMHYDGVEMDMGLDDSRYNLMDTQILQGYLDAKKSAGIQTPSLALNALCLNQKSAQKQTFAILDAAIQIAVQLEARTLQLPSFWEGGMRTEAEFHATAECLAYACTQAKKVGLTVASENQLDLHGNLRLIDMIGEENFGIYFDTANPYLFDERDGLSLLNGLSPFVKEVHVKDYVLTGENPCVPLGLGGCHAAESLALLKQRGYNGWLVVENQLSAEKLAQDVQYIKRHFF